jgi:hypothetical protein
VNRSNQSESESAQERADPINILRDQTGPVRKTEGRALSRTVLIACAMMYVDVSWLKEGVGLCSSQFFLCRCTSAQSLDCGYPPSPPCVIRV